MLRFVTLIYVYAILRSSVSVEDTCSNYHFLEKLLEKVVKMELEFKVLQNNINNAHSSMDVSLKSVETQIETLETNTEKAEEDLYAKLDALAGQYNYTTLLIKALEEHGIAINSTACPDKWTSFQNSCYLFGHEVLQFHDAQKYCETMNANLVNIEDQKENDFIRAVLRELTAPQHWIGMTDAEVEGEWKLYPSLEEVKFFDWGKYQPNNGRRSNCGAIWASFDYLWVDEPCSQTFRPICEKKYENILETPQVRTTRASAGV